MTRLVGVRGRRQQVAAQLADVLEDGRLVLCAVRPEAARREAPRDRDARSRDERCARRRDQARRVIERQRHVGAVVGRQVCAGPEGGRRGDEAVVAEVRRLRQAGRPARVDVEEVVARAQLAAHALLEWPAVLRGERGVEIERTPRSAALHPHARRPLELGERARAAFDELRADHQLLRARDAQRVREPAAREVRVHERADGAELREPEASH